MNNNYSVSVDCLKAFQAKIENFTFPEPYLKIVQLGLFDFEHWYILSDDLVESRYNDLISHYEKRILIPFAARYDCDDVACFAVGQGDEVFIIDSNEDEGNENVQQFETFWSWFISAIKELIGIFD